ncbi:H-NS family nucleoid-associated regulatory protein [Acidovorax facilis]|uniref:H-NS histone family protein n=1 Tax=Acidovorax facilis TaxID=12917 RepID=UPI003CF1DB73
MTTYAELVAQKNALDEQIERARKAESTVALATVKQLVQEFGFTAQQVFPWKPEVKRVSAKYYDPQSGATWSGRGKPPKWIAGKERERFAVLVGKAE